ncbi:MAG: hypothetical protein N838_24750 [Thiohalocapsa sp. PB-PSB1]|jgi:hypothetical protein|nr:MAG: hypothetical protein N838_24750 [Thiohalocapsa sp. PB-PSB1]
MTIRLENTDRSAIPMWGIMPRPTRLLTQGFADNTLAPYRQIPLDTGGKCPDPSS